MKTRAITIDPKATEQDSNMMLTIIAANLMIIVVTLVATLIA